MAKNDTQIAKNYVNAVPVAESEKLFSSVTDNGRGMGWSGNGPMYASPGTKRFWYDGNGFLYSYRMPLAHRRTFKGKPFILVNGDGAPSMMTGSHQRDLRDQLRSTDWEDEDRKVIIHIPHAYVPFSVLEQARIRPVDVEVLAVTEDREEKRKGSRKNRETGAQEEYEYTVHFLGETLFRYRDSIYVCGLDRNDDPNKRMFYMAKVPGPAHKPPKTVDEALLRMRPKGLPETALRQGEWFFVPQPDFKPQPDDITHGVLKATKIPIVSADPKAQLAEMTPITTKRGGEEYEGWTVRAREGRHVASSMAINGAVYAKGVVRDDEHSALKLGTTWHKIVKNLAVEGWRYVPGPMARASVD